MALRRVNRYDDCSFLLLPVSCIITLDSKAHMCKGRKVTELIVKQKDVNLTVDKLIRKYYETDETNA